MTAKRFPPSLFLALSLGFTLFLAACGATPASSWPGLAVRGNIAYVASNQQMHAVDLDTGKAAWSFPEKADNAIGTLYSEPGADEDIIVVGAEGPANSFSGALYGINPNTGTPVWCLAFDAKGADRTKCPLADGQTSSSLLGGLVSTPKDTRLMGGITLTDSVAYFGLSSGEVFAVDAQTGQAVWTFAATNTVWAAPLVTADHVYVASLDHFVYALDRATGELQWKADLGGALSGTPALADGTLYIGSFDKQLHALDVDTGNEEWAFLASNWIWGGPVEQDGVLYFGDISGMVYAVRAATGEKVWEAQVEGVVRGSPALTADTVFVAAKVSNTEGQLIALDIASGASRWQQPVKGQLLTTPVIVDGKVIIAPYLGDNLLMGFTTAGVPTPLAFAPSK